MLKKLIILENGQSFQYDTLEDLVKDLIDENFYNMSQEEKIKKIEVKCLYNDINSKINITNEITYILYLLLSNKLVLLERKDANIFTKDIDKTKIIDNYVVVNTFAKELLYNK